MTIVFLQNHHRWSNVLYLLPLKSGYLPLSSYISLTCETLVVLFNDINMLMVYNPYTVVLIA